MVLGVIYAVMKMGLMVARVSRAALSDILRGAHRSNCGIGACHGPVPRRAAGLIHLGGGLGVGSIILLLLGTQWYIFFNVSVGASAIPTDLKEVCDVFRLSAVERWRKLILPGIFPYLITGFVTASGGAWNASIVAEYFRFHGRTITTIGLGSIISRATDTGNFPVLLAGTIVTASMVVTVNRLLWRGDCTPWIRGGSA